MVSDRGRLRPSMSEKEKQFMGLYSAQSDAVFRFCFIRTRERETALDITQESFLKFWKVLVRGETLALFPELGPEERPNARAQDRYDADSRIAQIALSQHYSPPFPGCQAS